MCVRMLFISTYLYLIQELAILESMQLALENVVNAVFDDFGRRSSDVQSSLCGIFQGFVSTSFRLLKLLMNVFVLITGLLFN